MKFLDLLGLSDFLNNCKNIFANVIHTHKISEIEDCIIDKELSNSSINPVENRIIKDALDIKVPITRTINGKSLDDDIVITATELGIGSTDDYAAIVLSNANRYTDEAIENHTHEVSEITNFLFVVLAAIYPVGSIYISTSPNNPFTLYGFGTWDQIEDTFLLASGSKYAPGTTGGESEHILTIEELPPHSHIYKRHAFDRNDTDPETGEDVYGANNKTLNAHEGTTGTTGGGEAHNNMPPYLAVYVWKRTA